MATKKRTRKKTRTRRNTKSSTKAAPEQAFYFNTWNGPIGVAARDRKEFRHALRHVPLESLYYHLREDQNDFANWVEAVLKDKKSAQEIRQIKQEGLDGDHLRRALYFHC